MTNLNFIEKKKIDRCSPAKVWSNLNKSLSDRSVRRCCATYSVMIRVWQFVYHLSTNKLFKKENISVATVVRCVTSGFVLMTPVSPRESHARRGEFWIWVLAVYPSLWTNVFKCAFARFVHSFFYFVIIEGSAFVQKLQSPQLGEKTLGHVSTLLFHFGTIHL